MSSRLERRLKPEDVLKAILLLVASGAAFGWSLMTPSLGVAPRQFALATVLVGVVVGAGLGLLRFNALVVFLATGLGVLLGAAFVEARFDDTMGGLFSGLGTAVDYWGGYAFRIAVASSLSTWLTTRVASRAHARPAA